MRGRGRMDDGIGRYEWRMEGQYEVVKVWEGKCVASYLCFI